MKPTDFKYYYIRNALFKLKVSCLILPQISIVNCVYFFLFYGIYILCNFPLFYCTGTTELPFVTIYFHINCIWQLDYLWECLSAVSAFFRFLLLLTHPKRSYVISNSINKISLKLLSYTPNLYAFQVLTFVIIIYISFRSKTSVN